MDFNLPSSTVVNKFIPKNKFWARTVVSTKIKNEFTDKIQRITWKYKLSEATLHIPKTEKVEEIQIFEIELKEKIIPKNVLKIIDKMIPYPILYAFIYRDCTAFGMALREESGKYYFSDWNEEKVFDFTGTTLEKVYEKLIKSFIQLSDIESGNFQKVIEKDQKRKSLEREIQGLENKIKNEKQFRKKVEMNTMLLGKKKELETLTT